MATHSPKSTISFLALSIFTVTSGAATLQADALVCETEAALAHVLSNPRMSALTGTEAIAKSKAQIELLQPSAQGDSTAAMMRRINPDLQRRTEQAEKLALDGAKGVIAKCASSGVEPVAAVVLERRPISGAARISLVFRGSKAELYTALASVSGE